MGDTMELQFRSTSYHHINVLTLIYTIDNITLFMLYSCRVIKDCKMPSGLIPAHYGAPRHFSLPSIYPAKPKELVTVGHCDKLNLFYIREPTADRTTENSRRVALMKYVWHNVTAFHQNS